MLGMAHAPSHAAAEQLDEPFDDTGELDENDLAALRASIQRGEEQYQRGEYSALEEVLAALDEEDRRAGV
jgi:hypothetical protein